MYVQHCVHIVYIYLAHSLVENRVFLKQLGYELEISFV